MSVVEAAAGMYDVINVNMAAGVREVSVKRGHDPRDFPMVIAGGAGPNHASMIARELEIPVMIIPKESSIFCAAGMLMSDLRHNFVRTYVSVLDTISVKRFNDLFKEMEREGAALLESEHIPPDRVEYVYSLDMRYIKQYHEVNVILTRDEIESGDIASMAKRFHPEHDRLFGYSLEEEGTPIELINMRLACIGTTEKPRFIKEKYDGADPSHALKKKREIYLPLNKEFAMADIFDGHKLRYGNRVEGPAIIEQVNTTTFITPEYSVLCDRYGSYTMYVKEREAEFSGRIVQ
jgi:N-methylhydantoinase A